MTAVDNLNRVLKGDDARALLRDQIDHNSGGLHAALASFDVGSTVEAWLETLRAIEEFINLILFGLDDDAVKAALISLPVVVLQSR